jgi:hypothetical protein
MMDESENLGLNFRDDVKKTICCNPLGAMHNSYKGIFAKLRSRPRNIDAMIRENERKFHTSVFERQTVSPIDHGPYRRTKLLEVDETLSVDIFAGQRWNYTTLYLNRNEEYVFSAEGKWKDSSDVCDWKGTEDGQLSKGDISRAVGTFIGKFEDIFKSVSNNATTDFLGTKRVEDINWFAMVGAITNDRASKKAVANDGSATPHEYVDLTAHEKDPLKIIEPGYLYCFPNDVWSLYDNNFGSVRLTIRRTK